MNRKSYQTWAERVGVACLVGGLLAACGAGNIPTAVLGVAFLIVGAVLVA